MIVSKQQFFENLGEYCWAGNGHYDITKDKEIYIPEPNNSVYSKWIREWVEQFNRENDCGFQIGMRGNLNFRGRPDGYILFHKEPAKVDIKFPRISSDETYTLTKKEVDDAGPISKESDISDD